MGCLDAMKMGAAAVLWLLSSGCSDNDAFQCAKAADCDAGRCEPTGFCSFPDLGCASGYRYGELAGALSSQCVPEDATTNASGATSSTSSTSMSSEPPPNIPSSGGTTSDPTQTTGETDGLTTSTTLDTGTTSGGTTDPTTTATATESSGETSTETGPPMDCTTADFGSLPGAPLWFSYSTGGGSVTVSGGKLLLDVPDGGASGTLAGLRTATTHEYSSSRVTATFDSVPAAPVVTSNVTLGTATGAQSYAVVFRDGTVRVELFENSDFTLLGSADVDALGWPMTIEVRTEGGQVTTMIEGALQTEVLAQSDMPAWFGDIHASLNAGNPVPADPLGTVVADHFEICPPL